MNETKPTQPPMEAHGVCICVSEGGPAIARVLWGSRNPEICISKEYAAEIAKDMALAMNSHDVMLAALKAIEFEADAERARAIAHDAIAKAEGGAK